MGSNYLVTVHGPLNPVVDPAVAYLDTDAVLRRHREAAPATRTRVRALARDRVVDDPA